jgi:serine/threonine protein kinase
MSTSNDTTKALLSQKIAHYRIIRKIGQGGMSIVYEGLDEKLKRPVAIKVLHPFLAEGAEYRARFFREAQAIARLSHPNIVQIFDVAHADAKTEELYIVTELLEGQTLSDFCKLYDLKEFPEISCMIIWQVAQALEHAHQRGIIHRDLKPENIFVTCEGHIKLMDFGIASLGSEESITQSGSLMGSLAHLAPEVIKGQKASIASDIFSLCTVFYWMLLRELPFNGNSPHALLKAIVDTNPKKVQSNAFITDEIASVVEKGMKKDPAARFESCGDLSNALEHAIATLGMSIDKNIEAVLKDPKKQLVIFQEKLIASIKQQIEICRKENDQAKLLALECRLSATPRLKPRKKKIAPVLFFLPVLVTAAFLVFLIKLFNKPEASARASKIEENAPIIEAAPVLLKDVEEKMPEVEPAPIVKEVKVLVQEVEFIIWPFANVLVDGHLIAKDAKHVKLKLAIGVHRISFTHSYAATVEKLLEVTEKPSLVRISLEKTKPAFLIVDCNVSADVAIDKSYKGTTYKSLKTPIVIPMPDKTHSQMKEVIITGEGYEPHVITTEFIAGQIKRIDVSLKRANNRDPS